MSVDQKGRETKGRVHVMSWTAWNPGFKPQYNKEKRSWRDDLAVKSICCSGRGPRFIIQHPCGSWQPSVTPFPGNQHPLLASTDPECIWCPDTHVDKTSIHITREILKVRSANHSHTHTHTLHFILVGLLWFWFGRVFVFIVFFSCSTIRPVSENNSRGRQRWSKYEICMTSCKGSLAIVQCNVS